MLLKCCLPATIDQLDPWWLTWDRIATHLVRQLLADLCRQLSVDDKKAWKQLSDSGGKAIFIKHLPTPAESTLNQRSAMTHETNDKADDDPDH